MLKDKGGTIKRNKNAASGQVLAPAKFSSVQLLSSVVSDSASPWIAARQASLSITNSRSLLKLMSIKLVMPSNHLILRHPLLLLPSIFPSIRVFSSESVLHIRWPKYWSFISLSNEYSGLISFRISLRIDTRVFSSTTVQKHQFFGILVSFTFTSIHDYWKKHSFN